MMSDRKLATMMLSAVWNEDVKGLRHVLRMGAGPNWIFNGYPILIRVVFTRDEKIMMLLIKVGVVQVEEALGFALDRCIGEMIFPLVLLEIVPEEEEAKEKFRSYPFRYYPLDYLLPARAQTEGIMERYTAYIRMLQLLRSRGFMMHGELAQELDTNVRNAPRYRKGLEEAGYVIGGTTGKYGGYQLKPGALPPVAGLYEEELRFLQKSRRHLENRHDFPLYVIYCRAVDRSLAATTPQVRKSDVHVKESADVTDAITSVICTCEQGKDVLSVVELQYRSLHVSNSETTIIQPCEIVNVEGSYYCSAHPLKTRTYRNFRSSKEHMRNVWLTRRPFVRDTDLHIRDYIGRIGLIRDKIIELKLHAYGESARLISEKKPGTSPVLERMDEQTPCLTTTTEGRISVCNFLLSLGNQCQLVGPQDLKQETHAVVKDMLASYSQFLLYLA